MKGLRKIIIILKNKIKGFSEEEDVSDDIEENAVSKIFDRCLLIPDLSTPNNSAIAFCVIQIDSSFIMALTVTESSSVR